jgi:hypothetical protein
MVKNEIPMTKLTSGPDENMVLTESGYHASGLILKKIS